MAAFRAITARGSSTWSSPTPSSSRGATRGRSGRTASLPRTGSRWEALSSAATSSSWAASTMETSRWTVCRSWRSHRTTPCQEASGTSATARRGGRGDEHLEQARGEDDSAVRRADRSVQVAQLHRLALDHEPAAPAGRRLFQFRRLGERRHHRGRAVAHGLLGARRGLDVRSPGAGGMDGDGGEVDGGLPRLVKDSCSEGVRRRPRRFPGDDAHDGDAALHARHLLRKGGPHVETCRGLGVPEPSGIAVVFFVGCAFAASRPPSKRRGWRGSAGSIWPQTRARQRICFCPRARGAHVVCALVDAVSLARRDAGGPRGERAKHVLATPSATPFGCWRNPKADARRMGRRASRSVEGSASAHIDVRTM
mmetsp:Transcript_127188/g.368232  ORF Transcript_127188/g.368232 Transcript_127188/m.368232 type:complete len:367 (+) Transcript_127188:438-1538(+)